MWIVKLALRRPYTFVVMAILMLVLGVSAIFSMPTDIFPYINIPVASVIWSYNGMSPEEMADRIVTVSERAMTTTVNDIEHMESTTYNGVAVIRMYFQPNVKIEMAIAQITALAQTTQSGHFCDSFLSTTVVGLMHLGTRLPYGLYRSAVFALRNRTR